MNSPNTRQINAINKTKNLCNQLKVIINKIEDIVEPTSSLPIQQNNTRAAGVPGSIRDTSYHNWTTSLRS